MFDRRFFASKSGAAALVSIAAMVAFNLFVLTQQAAASPDLVLVTMPMVELA